MVFLTKYIKEDMEITWSLHGIDKENTWIFFINSHTVIF